MKTKSNNRKSAAGGIKAEGTVGFERENRYIRNLVNRRYPLYEPGRCLVGFMRKTDEEIAEHIGDLLRGHDRLMQEDIVECLRVYIIYKSLALTFVKHVDAQLLNIIDMIDQKIF